MCSTFIRDPSVVAIDFVLFSFKLRKSIGFWAADAIAYREPFPIALSVLCRVVYCGQTVQDRPIVCIEVE